MVGKTLGHYEILEPLGKGGMGEVYRARDTKLDQDVAIKVLPEDFADDPDQLARLNREAKLLASLNHPHIATIHSLEEAEGARFLVLELVKGESLAQRLRKGPLPIETALTIGTQVAEALEAAHGEGIVHRDLKPANVLITDDGRAKVLDFGIAKSMRVDAEVAATAQATNLTVAGTLVGTPSYMSPEQVRGGAIDKRVDIWAFGCLLFETLTAKSAFAKETMADTLAAIIDQEPDWNALPNGVPPQVRRLIGRCLRKDPDVRLHDIADARIEIEEALSAPWAEGTDGVATAKVSRVAVGTWIMSAVSVALALALWVVLSRMPTSAPNAVSFLEISPPPPLLLAPATDSLGTAQPTVAITGSGGLIAYVAREGSRDPRVYLRKIDEFEVTPLEGTEGAYAAFFSPDERWVGFFADNTLKKVAVDGGPVVPLAEAPNPVGAFWREDDTILFQTVQGRAMAQIFASGGTPNTIPIDSNVRFSSPLPQPQLLLAEASVDIGGSLITVNLHTGQTTDLGLPGGSPRLTPTGHLVYQRGLALWAVPFDAERLEVVGSATPVLDGVRRRDFAISQNGTLIYVPAEGSDVQTLTWLDPTENPQSAGFPSAVHGTFQTSPEGTHLAVEVAGITRDIWIYNLVTGDRERLTNKGNNGYPIWSPDGEWVAFRSDRFGPFNLFRKRASGAGDAERLTESEVDQATSHWGRPGGGEIWFTSEFTNQSDIQVLDLQTREVRTVVGGPDNQIHPTVSADGTLLAYTSSGSGYSEVYVKRLPESDEVKVSRAGGEEPVWARTENVLYYRNGFKWMRVEIGNDPRDASVAEEIFEGNYVNVGGRSYDVDSDGRFLLLKPAATTTPRINVILNWFEELKRLVPTGGSR